MYKSFDIIQEFVFKYSPSRELFKFKIFNFFIGNL